MISCTAPACDRPEEVVPAVTQEGTESTDHEVSPTRSISSPFHHFKPVDQGGLRFFAESSLRDGLISVLSSFGIHDLVLGLGGLIKTRMKIQ